ncbi:MAG TPA: cupredoxin domain-containing protein [Chloroflexota bacterium]|jgi:plastocyanin
MTAANVRSLLAVSLLLVLLRPVAAAAADQVITVTEAADQARWGFTPSTVAIALGDTVTFTNSGKVIHSFVANDNSFNSGVVNPGGVYAVRFGRPGQVSYICDIHPQMKGVIDVRAAQAAPPPTAGEQFFPETGFSVSDADGVRFLSEFRRFGGVQAVGYPASKRFQWDGFTVQVFQRVVFQWRPEAVSSTGGAGQAYFVNVFDRLHELGKDDWLLAAKQTPKHDPTLGDLAARMALLDERPAIKAKFSDVVGDPLQANGAPTSRVQDMGNHYALRAQRVVFQEWKEDVPWAKAGQVTVALGGDIAKEAGILPSPEALRPGGA